MRRIKPYQSHLKRIVRIDNADKARGQAKHS